MKFILRGVAILACMFFARSAIAVALLEAATGRVTSGASSNSATQLGKGQRILAGTSVYTGSNSQAVLRFEDGLVVMLDENSEFRISEYSFVKKDPSKDKFVFELRKGTIRSVSGVLTTRTRDAYALHIPQGTISIRGTDFSVAIASSAYMSVLRGTITASNSAGSVAFGAGTTATIASPVALATTIPIAALPASLLAIFKKLSSVGISSEAGPAHGGMPATEIHGAKAGGMEFGFDTIDSMMITGTGLHSSGDTGTSLSGLASPMGVRGTSGIK